MNELKIKTSSLGLKASDPIFHNEDRWKHLHMPKIDDQGRVLTLNKMGVMKTHHDHFTQAFIDASKACSLPVLEIGAAYGEVSIKALENGAAVIANDIELKHLLILRRRTPKKY